MKKQISIFIALMFIISCSPEKGNQPEKIVQKTEENNFDFLLGNWQRTNDEAGKQTFENWTKENDTLYLGNSFTLQENDTIWQELVRLSPIDGVWFFQVSMPKSNQSTNFKVTEQTTSSFTCENPQNEFPKIIDYSMKGNHLYAEISAGENSVSFDFIKLK